MQSELHLRMYLNVRKFIKFFESIFPKVFPTQPLKLSYKEYPQSINVTNPLKIVPAIFSIVWTTSFMVSKTPSSLGIRSTALTARKPSRVFTRKFIILSINDSCPPPPSDSASFLGFLEPQVLLLLPVLFVVAVVFFSDPLSFYLEQEIP